MYIFDSKVCFLEAEKRKKQYGSCFLIQSANLSFFGGIYVIDTESYYKQCLLIPVILLYYFLGPLLITNCDGVVDLLLVPSQVHQSSLETAIFLSTSVQQG